MADVPSEPKIALFDLDGSLADYAGAMRRDLEALRSDAEPPIGEDLWELEHIPALDRRMEQIKERPGWWRELPRIESGFEVLRLAKEIGFEINVLSKGPRRQARAWAEKLEWCANQPELENVDVHLTMNKGLVFGRVLYDDFPDYMNAWLEHRPRGLGIMPVTASNREYRHDNVVRWDRSNLQQVRAALEAAFIRENRQPWRVVPTTERSG